MAKVTDNTMAGDPTQSQQKATSLQVGVGNGNWNVFVLNPDLRYEVKHLGIDNSKAASTAVVKVVYGSQVEPDAGGVITYTGGNNIDYLFGTVGLNVIQTLRGLGFIAMKADANVMVTVRVLERNVGGTQG